MGLDSIKMLSAEARTKPQKINTLWLVASSAAWSPKGPSIACLRSGIWTSVDFFPSQAASLPQLGPFKNPRVEFPVRREENRIEHIWLRKEKKKWEGGWGELKKKLISFLSKSAGTGLSSL